MKCISKSVFHDQFFSKNLKYEMKSKTFYQIMKTYVIQFIISILYYLNLIKKFFYFINHCCDLFANHSRKSLIINFWYSTLTFFFIKTKFDFVKLINNFNHCFINKSFCNNVFFYWIQWLWFYFLIWFLYSNIYHIFTLFFCKLRVFCNKHLFVYQICSA